MTGACDARTQPIDGTANGRAEESDAVSSTIDAPLEWVESVGNLRLPPKADQRLQELMDRNNEGLLTEAEARGFGILS